MNPLDLYELDQKSWAFMNLIGQTPLSLSDAPIVTASSVVTPLVGTDTANDVVFKTNGTNRWQIQATAGILYPTADNTYDLGATSNRVAHVFTPIIDSGTTGSLSFKTNQVVRATIVNTGQLYPATDAAAAQTASGIFAGTGVPNNANGNNGDYYYRSDGTAAPTATKDHCYFKAAGAWGGVF